MELERVKLFKGLFKGREDIYPRMFISKAGKKGYSPHCRNRFKNGCDGKCFRCTNSDYAPLDDGVIRKHLEGKEVVGIYPLLPDETSYFVAADFDSHQDQHDPLKDVKEFYEVCQVNGISCYIERSRSGKGYHAWLFFDSKIPAWKSRMAIFALLKEAQAVNEDIELKTFDRLFPNQDKLNGKKLGNLIALPLQGKVLQKGNTAFLDMSNSCNPYPDQWAFLSTVKRISEGRFDQLIKEWDLKRQDRHPVNTPVSQETNQPGIENVLQCEFIKYCAEHRKDLSESLWRNMISNLYMFRGGETKIYELSQGYPNYSTQETEDKITHAKSFGKPITCEEIRRNGFKCSKSCGVKAPAALAYKLDGKKVVIDGVTYTETSQGYKKWEGTSKKTLSSFIIKPTLRIRLPEGETIKADISIGEKIYKDIHFSRDAWNSNQKFKRALPYCDMQWYGSDYDIQKVLALIAKHEVKSKQGTTLLGYNDGLWIIKDLVLSKEGEVKNSESVYVPNGNSLEGIIKYSTTDNYPALIENIYNNILKINQFSTILPIIGWFFAAPFAPYIRKINGGFPILDVWGTRGSGKTETLKLMWRLFGVESELFAVSMTPFTFLRLLSSTNSIPAVVDEYKPYDLKESDVKAFHRCIRRVYSGEVEGRGTPDLSVISYRLVAPLAFAGEQMPNEPAILERIIPVNFSPNIPEKDCYKNKFKTLRELNLTAFTERYIQYCLSLDVKPLLNEAERLALDLISKKTENNRIINNITTMIMGIRLFETYGQQYGIEFDEDIRLEETVNEVLNQLVIGEVGRTRLAIDNLIGMLSVMANNGRLKRGTHFDYNHEGELWFHFDSCFPEFKKYSNETKYGEEILNKNSYYRQMKEIKEEGGYIRDTSTNKYYSLFADDEKKFKQMRSVVIDYIRCPHLDLSGFGINNAETD